MVKGQSNTGVEQAFQSQVNLSARQLMIQWDSGSFISNQSWATAVLNKYQDKMVNVTWIPANNQAILVHFQDGKLQEEDLLQVMEMEGVPSPYFISNGRKFLLAQDKTLVNEPLK
jgi:hypothetical protein